MKTDDNEGSAGLGGGSTALRRWESSHSPDCAGALGMSRRHPSDMGPDALVWYFGDDRGFEKLSAWLTARVAAYARVAPVSLTSAEAQEWAPQVAAAHAMQTVRMTHAERHRGATITTEAIAKRLHVAKASYLALKNVAENCLSKTIRDAYRTYLVALEVIEGPELRSPAKAYVESMDPVPTMASPPLAPETVFSDSTRAYFAKFNEFVLAMFDKYFSMDLYFHREAVKQGRERFPYVAIDEATSYPQGTIGKCRRGILIAIRETTPVVGERLLSDCGWHVLASRPFDLRIEHDESRPALVKLVFVLTDGKECELPLFIPIPMGVGEYEAGASYDPMNVVIFDGARWIALRETDEQPGAGNAWERDFPGATREDAQHGLRALAEMIKEIAQPMLTVKGAEVES